MHSLTLKLNRVPLSKIMLVLSMVLAIKACAPISRSYEHQSILVQTYTYTFINIHYVEVGGKTLLFDTGNAGDAEKIEKHFKKRGLDLNDVDYLVITHGHPDHAGNAHYFKEKYGMQVIAGKGETELIASGGDDKNLCPRGFNGWIIKNVFGLRSYKPFQPDILVDGTFDLAEIGLQGKIIEVTSHTPGSIVTFIGDKAFTGDLIGGRILNGDKPTYHAFMCDLEKNMQDIELIAAEPGIKEWYSGHFGPMSIEDVKRFIEKNTN